MMNVLRHSFRRWWQTPRKAGEPHKDRRVSFLELFYDLVYVVVIARLAHSLSESVNLFNIGRFVFLFIIVWWAWFNGSAYHDLHGNNDVRTRVFTFLQMFTVAAMAVFIPDALGEGSVGFAISYSAFLFILTYMWWRTGIYDPDHRPLGTPYSLLMLIAGLLYVASIFVPIPWRFYLWGIALIVCLIFPLILVYVTRHNPKARSQLKIVMTLSPAIVERFGLFTIIVLGEVVVSVVQGVAGLPQLNWLAGGTAALGLLVAIGVWWIYFDFVSHRLPLTALTTGFRWIYLHLPMTMGIAATGAAIINIIEHIGEYLPGELRWLLVGGIAIAVISVAFLMRIIRIPKEHQDTYSVGSKLMFITAGVILLLGFSRLGAFSLLITMVLLMLIPAIYGLKTFIAGSTGKEPQVLFK